MAIAGDDRWGEICLTYMTGSCGQDEKTARLAEEQWPGLASPDSDAGVKGERPNSE
jgi:hypothetical protein